MSHVKKSLLAISIDSLYEDFLIFYFRKSLKNSWKYFLKNLQKNFLKKIFEFLFHWLINSKKERKQQIIVFSVLYCLTIYLDLIFQLEKKTSWLIHLATHL